MDKQFDKIFNDFNDYRLIKRTKISTMDTIIRNNEEDFNKNEIDVLLRGYIILIYAFWEGSYKKLSETFYNISKNIIISELPFDIKNPVVINLAADGKGKDNKISEIKDYNYLIKINNNIQNILNKKLSYFITKDHNLERSMTKFFKMNSNNPNYDILDKFLNMYSLSLKRITRQAIVDDLIPKNFNEILEFIIMSRNNIAHGSEHLGEYNDYIDCIEAKFLNDKNRNVEGVSGFLRMSSFFINNLYNEIVESFKIKYIHV